MVHGELIRQGKVEKLTYRQLHRLEKLDIQKEREKLLLGAPATAIYTAGEIAKAGLEGAFNTAAAIAGNPDPITQGVAIASGLLAIGWFVEAHPGLAKFLGLDKFPNVGPAGNSVPPPNPGPADENGAYCVRAQFPFGGITDACYATTAKRDAAHQYWINTGAIVTDYDRTPNPPPGAGQQYGIDLPPPENPGGHFCFTATIISPAGIVNEPFCYTTKEFRALAEQYFRTHPNNGVGVSAEFEQ